MASSPSTVAVFDVDDDDEFDWEAAVREIDSACEGPSTSTSSRPVPAAPFPHLPVHAPLRSSNLGRPACGPRQSTLDRFVGAHEKCGSGGCPENAGSDDGDDLGGELVVAVDIDMDISSQRPSSGLPVFHCSDSSIFKYTGGITDWARKNPYSRSRDV